MVPCVDPGDHEYEHTVPGTFIPSIPSSLFRMGDGMHGMDLACNRPNTQPHSRIKES